MGLILQVPGLVVPLKITQFSSSRGFLRFYVQVQYCLLAVDLHYWPHVIIEH